MCINIRTIKQRRKRLKGQLYENYKQKTLKNKKSMKV